MPKHLIYMATSPSGKRYIGQTSKTLSERWAGHCNMAAFDPYMIISKAIVKHGGDNFELRILCNNILDGPVANKLEVYFIIQYNTYVNGYNGTPGGGNRSNFKFGNRLGQKSTKAHRDKISKANTGKELTPEHRANISAGKKGKKHTYQHKLAVSKAIKEFWRKRKSGEYPEIIKMEGGKRCSSCLKFKRYSEYYSPREICKECTRIRGRRKENS